MASRNENVNQEEQVEKEIVRVKPPISNPKKEVIIAIDGDSLKYIVSYTGKDDLGNKKPEYTEEEYHIAEGLISEFYYKIVNVCEEIFNVKGIILCLKGNNNPRYKWYPQYKQNRPLSLPIIQHLHNYLLEAHSGTSAEIGETDDLLADIVEKGKDSVVICGFDKDLFQLASRSENGNWFYDYKKDNWNYVTKEQGKHHFMMQLIINDAGDNIKLCKGCGVVFANKVIKQGMTDWEYILGIWQAYMKCYKNNEEEALKNLNLAWKLLKLHTFEELKQLENEKSSS